MDTTKRAEELFASGHFCAEAVLQALAEKQGIISDIIPRIASGFCSGISRTNGPCGAVTGAIMGLNLAFGRGAPDKTDESRAQMLECYSFIQEFMDRFTAQFSETGCRELTGCDFTLPEDQQRYRDEKIGEKCAVFVREAAKIGADILDEESGA